MLLLQNSSKGFTSCRMLKDNPAGANAARAPGGGAGARGAGGYRPRNEPDAAQVQILLDMQFGFSRDRII